MQIMDSMDRSAQECDEARAELSESQGRVQALTQDMDEFKEIHASLIDSQV